MAIVEELALLCLPAAHAYLSARPFDALFS